MNLFVIARRLPDEAHGAVRTALRDLLDAYPQLDPATVREYSGGGLWALLVQTSEAAAAPRVYRHLAGDALTLYDGVPVASGGAFAAHDAADLARHWDTLDERLEGQFFAARLDLAGGDVELLSDPLGRHQTYLWRDGPRFAASNSGPLLRAACGAHALDEVGAGMFLTMGYAGGDRTLTEGIRLVPDGERWRWRSNEAEPRRRPTFPLADLARRPRADPAALAADLVAPLARPLEHLTRAFGPLRCPITAGRDSRILLGLALSRGLEPRTFSVGEDDHEDVRYGRRIAEALGLEHRQLGRAPDVAERWPELSRRVVLQNDGLVSLATIRNAAGDSPGERLEVQLYGGGGEYARGKWLTPPLLLRPPDRAGLERFVARRLDRAGGLATPAARAAVRAHVEAQVERLLGLGFAPADVPCAYFFHDYGRRWGGAVSQQLAGSIDTYSPYYHRAYLRAAFALRPRDRYGERLTRAILERLDRRLLELPFADPWRPHRAPGMALAHLRKLAQRGARRAARSLGVVGASTPPDRALQRQAWLEARLPELRGAALDDAGAAVWTVIDRAAFERLTAPEVPVSVRLRAAQPLFRALTLVQHDALRSGATGSPECVAAPEPPPALRRAAAAGGP